MSTIQNELRLSLTVLTDWTEGYFERFRPLPGEGLNSFTHIKPLGELALILYSFADKPVSPEFAAWLERMESIVRPMAESWKKDIDWKGLPAAIEALPEIGSALLIFPAIERLSLRPLAKQRVRNTFRRTTVKQAFSQVDVVFAQDLAGLTNCHDLSVELLLKTIGQQENEVFQSSTLYLVTHYVFFATKMGHRSISCTEAEKKAIEKCLNLALEKQIAQQNYDLLAELIMSLNWLQVPRSPAYTKGLEVLTAIVSGKGFVPGNQQFSKGADDFNRHYHACLMAIAAIGHSPQ